MLIQPVIDLILFVLCHHHIVNLHNFAGFLIEEILGIPVVQLERFKDI